MNALMGKLNFWQRWRVWICRAVLVLLTIAASGQIQETYADTSIALVGSVGNDGIGKDGIIRNVTISLCCCLAVK